MFKKIWNFIWYDDSLLSWIVNIILAFILVKFIIYPGLGLILSTQLPVVAVVSCSMEHNSQMYTGSCDNGHVNLDTFWSVQGPWYESHGITKEDFKSYSMSNGFNKGDIIFLYGTNKINKGDVIVFKGNSQTPIIHRVIKVNSGFYQTKGDNNADSYPQLGETHINSTDVIGKAFLRVPYLGLIKIWFTSLGSLFGR